MDKNTTIFDFTNDPNIIEECIGTAMTEKEYKERSDPSSRPFHLLEYAEYINDPNLTKEIQSVFRDELNAFFNE